MVATHTITVTTADGFQLAARRFVTAAKPRAVILIAGAMGVRQDFYWPFAHWLAQRGYSVYTFDYRGIGHSRPAAYRKSLRGFAGDVLTWARQDFAAVIDAAAAQDDGLALVVIGHSLGGQLVGFLPNHQKISTLIMIACGSGYWRENAPRLRRIVWWFWYLVVPVLTKLCGYFPGKRLNMVGDLPLQVMLQWRRWCLHPDYAVGVEGKAARQAFGMVHCPILSISLTDDEMMSARNIERMHACYTGAAVQTQRISPTDVAAARIGHFGFFREQFETTLWPRTLAWIERHTA